MAECGSKSAGMQESDFDAEQLEHGTQVELEHTCDVDLARQIAMDHLVESPDYYKALAMMESSFKREPVYVMTQQPQEKSEETCPQGLRCAFKHTLSAKANLIEAIESADPQRVRKKLEKVLEQLNEAEATHLAPEGNIELTQKVRALRKDVEDVYFGDKPLDAQGVLKEMDKFLADPAFTSPAMRKPCDRCSVKPFSSNPGNPGFASKKPLSSTHGHNPDSRRSEKMADTSRMVTVGGFSFLGKILERGVVEVDKAAGMAGNPVYMRPSTWINALGGLGLLVAGGWGSIRDPYGLGLMVWGAHHLTKVVDYAEEAAGIPTGQVVYARPSAVPSMPSGAMVPTVSRGIF